MPLLAAAVDVVLRDGSTVHVRPVTSDDRGALRDFLASLSDNSLRLRYFTGAANLDWAARAAAEVAYPDSYALVATRGDGRVVAHATYGRAGTSRAEVAFAVSEELHGMGIATTLLAHLAEAAEAVGIETFVAEVLPDNHRMIEVFRESGFAVSTHSLSGVVEVEFPTAISPEAQERFEARERVAATAAVHTFLAPASVAVVGASRRPGSIGNATLRNLLAAGFAGPVYAVNANADSVESLPAWRSIGDIPGPVELAVIAVPAPAVVDAARDCAASGVRALVVISAGFAETGGEGAERQAELVQVCRDAGMRLVGPNCLGVLNTAPDVRLNATFAPAAPPRGRVGLLSQSGALGLAIMDHASALGLGLSSFVSNGNKADISGNDLLQYWEQDGETDLAVLYLESFGNPRKFSRVARRVGMRKPILAVKSGRTPAGTRATSSHTGALISASDATVDALFRQAGVIRADTLSELFDIAKLLEAQPAPVGPRVGIVTNGGGLGILCADACEAAGLEVPDLPAVTQAELGRFLPAAAGRGNPVDMIASATGEDYVRTIAAVAGSGAVDSIVAIFVAPLSTRAESVAGAMAQASATTVELGIPLAAVFASGDAPGAALTARAARIPSYEFPEDAARAVAKAAGYGRWRSRDPGVHPHFADLRPDEAAAGIAEALAGDAGWLDPAAVSRLLSCYGLATPAARLVRTADEAADAARELGSAVALKAIAAGLVHKTEAGAVAVGLSGRRAVAAAAKRILAAVTDRGLEPSGLLVQAMAPAGVEMLVGMVHDELFGPVIACGGGGTTAELIGDVELRLTPVTDRDANEMVRALKTYPLLTGFRGTPPADVGALEDVVLRLSALVDEHPEVAEVDLNPVVVSSDAALIVDARVRVEPAPAIRSWPAVGS